ncbi:hypothetical protein E1200_32495 [Actinomadura sp. GC306]|uniref:hypothetical protein n=1 Tax=Actinomadura sp. GC306 TaxID=2530367 RepID=UPI00104BBF0C|nr:hypothetical protein [Actinomadura sp. GC306]TDC59118.1 hypothetical protein E1200_32495 [Actinomadura sp. GC306]
METPPTRESTTREESTAGESEPEEPAAREAAAREEFGGGGSLSSEPAPPLDALPEPRPSLDPLPEPSPGPPALLPTDVELVRSRERAGTREQRPLAATTRPDIPMPAVFGADEEEHDIPPSDRAEDPDAGDHPAAEGGARAGGEPEDDWNPPPSSSFRSGPTPPVD